MKKMMFVLSFLGSALLSQSQDPQVTKIDLHGKNVDSVAGDLKNGAPMADLSWAWSSANACFPATQQRKFTGNHVLYEVPLPAYSEMKITVIPNDKNADFSLYAYQVGETNGSVVPNLSACIRCEADHKWDYKKRGQVQDHTRSVKDLLAISTPYKVIIGVVGANGLTSGGFTLKIELTKR